MSRAIERVIGHMKNGENIGSSGAVLGTVITDNPVTIQLSGDSIATSIEYFIYAEGQSFKKGETVIATPIGGATSTGKQFVIRTLDTGVTVASYSGDSYSSNGISFPAGDVFCPFPITPGDNAMLFPNRFPIPGQIWVVTAVWQ